MWHKHWLRWWRPGTSQVTTLVPSSKALLIKNGAVICIIDPNVFKKKSIHNTIQLEKYNTIACRYAESPKLKHLPNPWNYLCIFFIQVTLASGKKPSNPNSWNMLTSYTKFNILGCFNISYYSLTPGKFLKILKIPVNTGSGNSLMMMMILEARVLPNSDMTLMDSPIHMRRSSIWDLKILFISSWISPRRSSTVMELMNWVFLGGAIVFTIGDFFAYSRCWYHMFIKCITLKPNVDN